MFYRLRSLIWAKLLSHETHLKGRFRPWTCSICLLTASMLANIWRHTLHLISTSWWFLMWCLCNWFCCAKASPQSWHVKSLWPWWIVSMCLWRLKFEPKLFPQFGHGILAIVDFNLFTFSEICYVLYFQSYQTTILQKLSKCEVKTWLCWNCIMLLPLRFYAKSNFGELKQSKNVIFGNFGGSEIFVFQFEPWFKSQIYPNSIFRVSEIVKMAILPKMISRKTALQLNSWISTQWWVLTSHF